MLFLSLSFKSLLLLLLEERFEGTGPELGGNWFHRTQSPLELDILLIL